jgi:hypothetical protein
VIPSNSIVPRLRPPRLIFVARFKSILIGALFLCGAAAASRDATLVGRKLDAIERGRLRPGSRVDFRASGLNAWLREQAARYFPGAVSRLRLDLANSAATVSATVDFVKLRQEATGESPGWIMRNLFSGERSVLVRARVASSAGKARVDVDRVEISGVAIEGRALDFLIQTYVRPTFPDVKLSEWFRLADRVDHLSITPAGASVFIGR